MIADGPLTSVNQTCASILAVVCVLLGIVRLQNKGDVFGPPYRPILNMRLSNYVRLCITYRPISTQLTTTQALYGRPCMEAISISQCHCGFKGATGYALSSSSSSSSNGRFAIAVCIAIANLFTNPHQYTWGPRSIVHVDPRHTICEIFYDLFVIFLPNFMYSSPIHMSSWRLNITYLGLATIFASHDRSCALTH